MQLILRTELTDWLETETGIGMLFDDQDTSDPLWNAGLRFNLSPSASLLAGARGTTNNAFDSDEVLYEVGFRFDLGAY